MIYDAEEKLGLKAAKTYNDMSAAVHNSGRWNELFGRGLIDDEVSFAPKEFAFADTVRPPAKVGIPRIRGRGGRGYPVPSDAFYGNIGGWITRFTMVAGLPLFSLPCTGAIMEGIEFRGQPYQTSKGGFLYRRPKSLIEIVGKKYPASGRDIFRDCGFMAADAAIRFTIGPAWGKLPDGCPTGDENHADNCLVDNPIVSHCGALLSVENQQSMCLRVNGLDANSLDDSRMVMCDVARGGNITINCGSLNHKNPTIFRVGSKDDTGFSPNSCSLTCTDFRWDTIPDGQLRLFEYAGPILADMHHLSWRVRISGHIANENYPPELVRAIVAPPQLPTHDILFDVRNMPPGSLKSAPCWSTAC